MLQPMSAMRTSLFIAAVGVCVAVLALGVWAAEERIRMVGPSPAEEAARTLMESLEMACNASDCETFLAHFTPKRATALRKHCAQLFATQSVQMEVHEVSVLKETDNTLWLAVRYGLADPQGQKQVLQSELVAAKTNEGWKVDLEKVKRREVIAPLAQAFEFGGAGQVVLNADEDFWLPRDIARSKGGCAGGRCGTGR